MKDQLRYARFQLGDGTGVNGKQVLAAGHPPKRRCQATTCKLNN